MGKQNFLRVCVRVRACVRGRVCACASFTPWFTHNPKVLARYTNDALCRHG